jgi:excisionase family DNA binding protein
MKNERLLRVSTVSQRLNCSKSSVYRLVSEGKLLMVPVGPRKGYRIPESSFTAYLQQQLDLFYGHEE